MSLQVTVNMKENKALCFLLQCWKIGRKFRTNLELFLKYTRITITPFTFSSKTI